MSIKLLIVTVLALACIAQSAMVKKDVISSSRATKVQSAGTLHTVSRGVSSTKKGRSVESAGSLSVASRQDDDYSDEGEDEGFDDYDEGDEGEEGYDETYDDEPEESAPAPAPKPKETPKEPATVKRATMHMEYTTKYPTNCKCILGKGLHNGVCYEFTAGKKCRSRPCKPSYVCIDGAAPKSAVTCLRKKNTKKVVSNGDGTCKVEQVTTYGYVPYTS